MTILFTFALLTVTISAFLYVLSAYDNKSIDKSEEKRQKELEKRGGEDPSKIFNKKWDKNIPRPRICPVCGAYLKKHEFLFASIRDPIGNESKQQAHIYGCRYCYLGITDQEISQMPRPEESLEP